MIITITIIVSIYIIITEFHRKYNSSNHFTVNGFHWVNKKTKIREPD